MADGTFTTEDGTVIYYKKPTIPKTSSRSPCRCW